MNNLRHITFHIVDYCLGENFFKWDLLVKGYMLYILTLVVYEF